MSEEIVKQQDTGLEFLSTRDLNLLEPADRTIYLRELHKAMGISPFARAFDFIQVAGPDGRKRTILYANRTAADQLANQHKIESEVVYDGPFRMGSSLREDVLEIVMLVKLPTSWGEHGPVHYRILPSVGCVTVGYWEGDKLRMLQGDALGNAKMKAYTKAWRRGVLSIMGCGFPDEVEVETIPGVQAPPAPRVVSPEMLAEEGRLITFGIVPDTPETGYGYIRKGKGLHAKGRAKTQRTLGDKSSTAEHASPIPAFFVDRFIEKPDLETAKKFVASGNNLWNSGMFMFTASAYLKELKRFAPDILASCQRAYKGSRKDLDFLRLDDAAFSACPSDSIDYAVMEKTQSAAVIPLDAGWSDVGSWSALWHVLPKNKDGNALIGDVIATDVTNSFIYSGSRLVSAIGISNCILVETSDAVLVVHKDEAQKVKQIVDHLKKNSREEALLHRCVNRPWGTYECIDTAERFQVKRITAKPGATLSLQKHMHRAEHWIVVRGTARVTRGDEVITISENQSTYIPLGITHRLENPGKIPLELIEVQSGSYLGEDDIERFDDQYGRHVNLHKI